MRYTLVKIGLWCVCLCVITSCHTTYKSKAKMYRRQAQHCNCKGYSYHYSPSKELILWKESYDKTNLSSVYETIR